jgi:hypothetical protein
MYFAGDKQQQESRGLLKFEIDAQEVAPSGLLRTSWLISFLTPPNYMLSMSFGRFTVLLVHVLWYKQPQAIKLNERGPRERGADSEYKYMRSLRTPLPSSFQYPSS